MVTLNREDYRKKVLGCWMGKNIGGTLGAPFEWRRQVNDVSFYTQDLGGEPLPNDDLDIQLLWLVALEEMGIGIDAHTLADYWCLYVTPHWSEYGTGKVNMRAGLLPALSGTVSNAYKDSCGAFIRSEIWACIAPACPGMAARYAYEDAILDHGNGEGTRRLAQAHRDRPLLYSGRLRRGRGGALRDGGIRRGQGLEGSPRRHPARLPRRQRAQHES